MNEKPASPAKSAQRRNRREQINLRFSEPEHAEVRGLANRYGVSVSGIIRMAIKFFKEHGPLS